LQTLTLLLFTFCFTPSLIAKTVEIKPKNTEIKWVGKKVMGQHDGTIKLESGKLNWENNTIIGGEFVIDMSSIKVKDLKKGKKRQSLESHLKNDDFFAVDKHPKAKLVLKNVNLGKGGKYEFLGALTIKGITKPISFEGDITKGEKKIKAKADIKVNRTLYDIKYKSKSFFKDLGDKFIEDIFTIDVSISFKRPKENTKK
jgi:polyisoprenoid-binding protein YceI